MTGGTVCQVCDEDGILRSSKKNYLKKIPSLKNIANVETITFSPIDSTNMETSDREKIVEVIKKNYRKFDGFVIIHGTDTLVDSAAAISYMIRDLGKPIVITGSQLPIWDGAKSDASRNIYYSVKVATMNVGEVVIVFGEKVLRGVRSQKEDERGFEAFNSSKIPLLGEIGVKLSLRKETIPRRKTKPSFFTKFETSVEYYPQMSGTNTQTFQKMVEDSEVKGIVIGGYGAGNINAKYLAAIREAKKMDKPVMIITKCPKGFADSGIYAVGNDALNAGAFSGRDLTPEAAIQKMMYALGLAKKEKIRSNKRRFVKSIINKPIGKDIS